MLKQRFILLFIIIPGYLYAQENKTVNLSEIVYTFPGYKQLIKPGNDEYVWVVDSANIHSVSNYNGGDSEIDRFYTYFQSNLHYSKEMLESEISGKLYVKFNLD